MFDCFYHNTAKTERQACKMCEGSYTFAHFYNFYNPLQPRRSEKPPSDEGGGKNL